MSNKIYKQTIFVHQILEDDVETMNKKFSVEKRNFEEREQYFEEIFPQTYWMDVPIITEKIKQINDLPEYASNRVYTELVKLAIQINDIDLIQYLHLEFSNKIFAYNHANIFDDIISALKDGKFETSLYFLVTSELSFLRKIYDESRYYFISRMLDDLLIFCIRYDYYSVFVEIVNKPVVSEIFTKLYGRVKGYHEIDMEFPIYIAVYNRFDYLQVDFLTDEKVRKIYLLFGSEKIPDKFKIVDMLSTNAKLDMFTACARFNKINFANSMFQHNLFNEYGSLDLMLKAMESCNIEFMKLVDQYVDSYVYCYRMTINEMYYQRHPCLDIFIKDFLPKIDDSTDEMLINELLHTLDLTIECKDWEMNRILTSKISDNNSINISSRLLTHYIDNLDINIAYNLMLNIIPNWNKIMVVMTNTIIRSHYNYSALYNLLNRYYNSTLFQNEYPNSFMLMFVKLMLVYVQLLCNNKGSDKIYNLLRMIIVFFVPKDTLSKLKNNTLRTFLQDVIMRKDEQFISFIISVDDENIKLMLKEIANDNGYLLIFEN